jgi:hypothetical protein
MCPWSMQRDAIRLSPLDLFPLLASTLVGAGRPHGHDDPALAGRLD